MLEFISQIANASDGTRPPISTTHLWFLYYLVLFYAAWLVLHAAARGTQRWQAIWAKLQRFLFSTPFLLLVAPLLMVPGLATQSAPHPAPEQLMPRLWAISYFGLFFAIGIALYRDTALIDRLRPYVLWLTLSSVVLYLVFYSLLPSVWRIEDVAEILYGSEVTAGKLLVAALEAYISMHMTLVCLVAGKAFLDQANRFNRFIADASYWVYIVHLPVLFWLQFLLLRTDWPLVVEFLLSSFGTLLIGVITYVLLCAGHRSAGC